MADKTLFRIEDLEEVTLAPQPVDCLGMHFDSDDARRNYFREELRKKLPQLRDIDGFPNGSDEDILNLSDPPYYTACPNPWLNDLIAQWESEKNSLREKGKRSDKFKVKTPYGYGISVGKNSALYNAHTYHTKVPHEIIMRYILHYSQPGDIVLDGFGGTGMTGVAASACENPSAGVKSSIESDFSSNGLNKPKWGIRHSICGDLSPLCFHISSNYNRATDTSRLQRAVDELVENLLEKFGGWYEYRSINGIGHINYFVWSEIVACSNCGQELNVHDLSYDYDTQTLHKKLVCPKCGTSQEKKDASRIMEVTYDKYTDETSEQMKYECTLFNYSISKKGRYFSRDMQNVNIPQHSLFVPKDKLPNGYNTDQPIRTQGYSRVHQFYTERTLCVLSYLYDRINNQYKSLSKELMFIFTSMLPKLTKMNRYMPQHGSRALVGPMANTLYISSQCVENNPIDQFSYQAGKVIKAFKEIKSGAAIQVCSASNLLINDNSIDYIFTDPPFGSNIMYSELNFITESWLKVKTQNKEEAISNPVQHKGIFEYQEIMTKCFEEYYRVLKPGHWITVEFSNTSASVWNALQHSLQSVGFIISSVTDLNKGRGGLKGITTTTAVNQDLAITCFKPSETLINKYSINSIDTANVWDFISELLEYLPVHITENGETTAVVERSPKILFDRLVAYYVQHGYPVSIDALDFQKGLRERFIERDGMFFTASQALEYEEKKAKSNGFKPMSLFIGSEADGIEWLNRKLETPRTYQELQPDWMKDMVSPKKGDILPGLNVILEENFIQDASGRWCKPDPENASHLEQLRGRRLMKEFNLYLEAAQKPKAKRLKEARLEVLRYGFKECNKAKNYKDIVLVGDHIEETLLMEDEQLLMYYLKASKRV